jgi:hypothetical protein
MVNDNKPWYIAVWDHNNRPTIYEAVHRQDLEAEFYLVRAERLARAADAALIEYDAQTSYADMTEVMRELRYAYTDFRHPSARSSTE